MRKLAVLLAVAALTVGLAACGGDDDDDAASTTSSSAASEGDLPDLGGKTVTVAVENAYLPFNYIDPTSGEPAGWDYDAWNAICEQINCKADFKEAAWEGMIQAVADGQFDAAADGITINDERKQQVDFSDGYITVDQRLLVRKGEDRFDSAEDVTADTALKIGTQTGTTNFETASELWGESRIQAFEQFPFAVQALINGDVDVVIMDETAGQGYVGANSRRTRARRRAAAERRARVHLPEGQRPRRAGERRARGAAGGRDAGRAGHEVLHGAVHGHVRRHRGLIPS